MKLVVFGAFEIAVVFAAFCGSVFGNIVVIVELFDVGCGPVVSAGAFLAPVSVVVFTGDVLDSDCGNAGDFSSCAFVSAVVTEGVSLCVGLSVPATVTLWVNGFSLVFLVLSVELRRDAA